jgi:hypothetical protein
VTTVRVRSGGVPRRGDALLGCGELLKSEGGARDVAGERGRSGRIGIVSVNRLIAMSVVLVVGVIAGVLAVGDDDGSTRRDSVEARKPPQGDTTAEVGHGRGKAPGSTSRREGSAPRQEAPTAKQQLSAPELTATRSGGDAIIRYSYSARQWEHLPAGAGLVLAVVGSEQGSLPRNVIFRLTERSGERRLGLPPSAGPYLVHAQTLAGEQLQGKPVTIRLR